MSYLLPPASKWKEWSWEWVWLSMRMLPSYPYFPISMWTKTGKFVFFSLLSCCTSKGIKSKVKKSIHKPFWGDGSKFIHSSADILVVNPRDKRGHGAGFYDIFNPGWRDWVTNYTFVTGSPKESPVGIVMHLVEKDRREISESQEKITDSQYWIF